MPYRINPITGQLDYFANEVEFADTASYAETATEVSSSYSDFAELATTASYANKTNLTNLTNLNDIQLGTNPSISGHIPGRLFYDSVWNTLSVDIDTDVTLQIGQEEHVYVYNNTANTILNGQAVYINGIYSAGSNNVPAIDLAISNTNETSQVFGVATQDISINSYGFITVRGNINDLNTNRIGNAYLQTQGLFIEVKLGGTLGNSYTFEIINTTAGGLSYTETSGALIVDLGGSTPTRSDFVTYLTITNPSTLFDAHVVTNGNIIVASQLSFANGIDTAVGDILYLSPVIEGGLTTIKPIAPNYEIRLGRLITKSSTTGQINIRIIQSYKLDDLSDVSAITPTNGDIIIYNSSTNSWKNAPNTLPTYNTISALKVETGIQDLNAICNETSTLYRYETNGTSPINYGTPDNKYVLITGDGGTTRWIGTAGLYCYNQKNNTFVANKLIAGTNNNVLNISGSAILDNTVGSQLFVNVTGGNQNLTLPDIVNSLQSQYLLITVIGTSAYRVILQTDNTNFTHTYEISPDESAFLIFGQSKWHLIGGKKIVTTLNLLPDSTYKTTQDWSDTTQSGGLLTGGIITDDNAGGINISALTAICKIANSQTAENVFMDMLSDNIPSAQLTNNTINFIYVDYNDGSPTFNTTVNRLLIRNTDQFLIGQVYKEGLEIEITNGLANISNFNRRELDRLLEIRGLERVSGADISEIDNRYLESTNGLYYFGLDRITTNGQNTFISGTFDYYFKDGYGGWNRIEAEHQIDNLRFDNNAAAIEVGSGILSCSDATGLIKIETNAVHGLSTNDYVTISGVTGTVEANGTWKITYVSTTEFTLNNSVFVTSYISGGIVNNWPMGKISGGYYGVFWVYLCAEGDIYVLYGQNEYSLADAKTALVPSTLPSYLYYNARLAAKIIILQNATNFYSVESAYAQNLASSPTSHNNLNGLDGGATNEYYHLTAAEYSTISGVGAITAGGVNRIALYSTSPTGKTLSDNILDTDTSNNIILEIVSHSLSSNRKYTIPNAGNNSEFVMSYGDSTLNGIKTFTNGINCPKIFAGTDSENYVTFYKADKATPVITIDSLYNTFRLNGVGASTITALANTKLNSYDTINGYVQNVIQNLSNGPSASTEWIATADNGNDSTNYIDFGINGSGFVGGGFFPGGWTINGADDGYLYVSDGELALGTTNNSSLKAIRFFTGNPTLANQKGMITGLGKWSNGSHTPTAYLHLKAGSTTTNTAPLKFTSGLLLSTPEDGAMEYNGSLHFTSGSTRTNIVLSEGNQTINGNKTFTSTITGSITGLVIAPNKLLTNNNNLTLIATDGATLNIGNGGILQSAAYTSSDFYLKHDEYLSAGLINIPAYQNFNNGTLGIESNTVRLFNNSTFSGSLEEYILPAYTASFTNNIQSYIVASYNSGSPVYDVISDVELITESEILPVVTVYRSNNDLRMLSWDSMGAGLSNKIHQRLVKTRRFERESGLILSETQIPIDRTIVVSEGKAWNGINRTTLAAFNSSTNTLREWYHSGSIWVSNDVTAYNNTNYDNGIAKISLTDTKFASIWFYRCKADNTDIVSYVWSSAEYNSISDAITATAPIALPTVLIYTGLLIGRIIIQKNASSGLVSSIFDITLPNTTVINHNDTVNLNAGDYIHLTATEKSQFNIISASYQTDSGSWNTKINNVFVSQSNYVLTSNYQTDSGSWNTKINNVFVSESKYVLTSSYINDSSSFDTRINNVFLSESNYTTTSTFNQYTQSNDTKVTNIFTSQSKYVPTSSYQSDSGSWNIGINSKVNTSSYQIDSGSWNTKQAGATNLTSLSGLTYVSASFVKMTGTNAFTLDTTLYQITGSYLLTTGATTGATTQAQAFTNGVKTGYIYPATDNTTGFQIRNSNGVSASINIDTSNNKMFIGGNTAPAAILHLQTGSASVGTAPLKFTTGTLLTNPESGSIEYNNDFYYTMANLARVASIGILYTDVADYSNSGGGGAGTETTLATYTMPGNTLDINNEYVEIGATISVTGAGNSIIKLYFGSTVIYTVPSGNYTGQSIQFRAKVFRTGAATQKATVTATASGNAITSAHTYTTPAETLSGNVIIKVTGQNGTANRVTQRTFDVRHCAASA